MWVFAICRILNIRSDLCNIRTYIRSRALIGLEETSSVKKHIFYQFILLCLVTTSLASYSRIALSDVKYRASLSYAGPLTAADKDVLDKLKSNGDAEVVTEFVNDLFKLPSNLFIFFGAKDGPLFNSATNTISIPYRFITLVENYFIGSDYLDSEISPNQATSDVLIHTLFHELAHALIFAFDLPIVGKEEDAADSFATLMLIEYFDEGQEVVISAADLFELEHSTIKEFSDEDFWDEHSFDLQRYYSALCLVYGSDPKQYSALLSRRGISKDKEDSCISEYEEVSANWEKLLSNHITNNDTSLTTKQAAIGVKI